MVTDGTGAITGTIAGVHSGISAASSVGHAIVVHDGSNRIACGVCVPTCTANMAAYPGYAGPVNLAGTVKATATGMDHFSSTIDLDYQLIGAEPSAQGGIHIHTGTTCADASLVSGHYFATASDPWSTSYQTDAYGAVTGTIAGVAAGLGFNAIVDHTIVVHDSGGARIGCGVCRPDSVAPLPLCSSPGAPEISVCGDLKSVFKSNTCCGISAKPLNNSLFRPAQAMPSSGPSTEPTSQPSTIPSSGPSTEPTSQPSTIPSNGPSSKPTRQPSAEPSTAPTSQPTAKPSGQPTLGAPPATTGKAWGNLGFGGDASSVDLTNLVDISCGGNACVARKSDGTGLAWGDSSYGGDAISVTLTDLVDISCGAGACVARKSDGTGLAWGHSTYGGDASSVTLTDLVDISCGYYACVARKSDGTGLAWGRPDRTPGTYGWESGGYGGDASSVDLTNLVDISCGNQVCVAR